MIQRDELLQILNSVLHSPRRAGGLVIVPTVFIPIRASLLFIKEKTRRSPTWASELALAYLANLGFKGDRIRQDFHGYLEIFRDLLAPPPWVDVEPDDVEAGLPRPEIRPLYCTSE